MSPEDRRSNSSISPRKFDESRERTSPEKLDNKRSTSKSPKNDNESNRSFQQAGLFQIISITMTIFNLWYIFYLKTSKNHI